MLVALRNTESVVAQDVTKEDGPFTCPWCEGLAIVKHGLLKVSHFAHKSNQGCEYSGNESELHKRCKLEIYNALKLREVETHLEYKLDGIRPDIYIPSKNVGVEIQLSNLNLKQMIHRTKIYHQLGIGVLWVTISESSLERSYENWEKPAKAWENFLHTLYYGRVYYWVGGLNVLPVHFGLKGRKRPFYPALSPVNLLTDFKVSHYDGWSKGKVEIPEATIYRDKLRP